MLKGIILFVLVHLAFSSLCTNITIGSLTYDLSYLTSMKTITNYVFSPCTSIQCTEDTGYLYDTFITYNQNQQCTALTYGSQPSPKKVTETSSGLILNYSAVTKYPAVQSQNTSEIKVSLNIICESSTNAVQNVSITDENGVKVYSFYTLSKAGCSFENDTQIWTYFRQKAIVFALIFWIMGLYSMFLGYFLIRVTVLIYGFVTAAGFSLIFFTFGYPMQDQSASVLNWMMILASIFGIFYGFFLITLPRFGYFNIGVWFGFIISLLLQNSAFVYTKTLIPFYVCLGVISFVCGVAGIMGFKYFIIVSTSVISGFLLVRPLGFYLPYYPNEFNFYKQSEPMPWQYYLYLVAIIILSIISVVFQSWLFKKRGRKDKLFHLQDDTDIKTKFKNLLQFKQIKDFFKKGTNQFKLLKNLVTSKHSEAENRQSEVEEYSQNKGKYVPPISDQVSNQSQSERESEVSIEMKEIKKPKNNRKNR